MSTTRETAVERRASTRPLKRAHIALALGAASLAWLAPPSDASERESAGSPAATIVSCVSDARIAFAAGDLSAVLDDADARAVSVAIARRYPVVERDGTLPARMLLWQRESGELLYVALLANPDRPSEQCFTATFAASRFDITLLLRRKYLPTAS